MTEKLTDDQAREVERLVREEGLTEEQATTLATERQFDVPPEAGPAPDADPEPKVGKTHRAAYIDIDSDDEFLDLQEPVYEPDGRPDDGSAVEALLERGARLPALPAPTG